MKTLRFSLSLGVAALLGAAGPSHAQGVGVGTAAPDASAPLAVASATQARRVLLPRLNAAQRATIASPAPGLLVFQTDALVGLYTYSGQAWLSVATGLLPDDTGSLMPANQGQVNALSTASLLNQPASVAVNSFGVVYVADMGNSLIRQITPAGQVSTLASDGAAASFSGSTGVAVDVVGTVYVADANNNLIRKITSDGLVSTLAGGSAGTANGQGAAAGRPRGPASRGPTPSCWTRPALSTSANFRMVVAGVGRASALSKRMSRTDSYQCDRWLFFT